MKNKFHAMFMIGLIISLPIYTSTVFADSGVIEYKTVLLNGVGNPEQVQNLISTSVSYDSVSFSWDAVDPENFSYYKVYRSNIHVANTTDTSYTDDGVEPETSYSYQVSTVDIFEIEGEKSATLSVTTPASPYPIHSEPHYTAVDILDARITWITNIPADSKVEYGLEQTLGEQVSSENLVLEHSILLDELEPDKMYFYKVTSCSDVYCTSSEIRNFTTPHYQLPFINVTIPRYYQLASMNIHGKTTPGTEITLFTNNLFDDSDTADQDGDFIVRAQFNPNLPIANVIKINGSDIRGVSIEETFQITVDIVKPELDIEDVPLYSMGETINVKGTVTDSSTVSLEFFVTPHSSYPRPKKVGNLTGSFGQEMISLEWNTSTESDFKRYIIYRDGEPIEINDVSSDNRYTDTKIKTLQGREFTYQVVVEDQLCQRSGNNDVKSVTASAFNTDNHNFTPVNDTCVINPLETRELIGDFDVQLPIQKGMNEIKVVATDVAGNKAEKSFNTTYDSGIPVIEYDNIAELDPTYDRSITIRGNVTEWANVSIYVNGEYVDHAITGTDNWFEKEIDLFDWYEPFELFGDESGIGFHLGGEAELNITLIAKDKAGLDSDPQGWPKKIRYLKCGEGAWWNVFPQDPVPQTLIPRHIIEGIAQVTLPIELTWAGGFEPGTISSATVSVLDMSIEESALFDKSWIGQPTVLWNNGRKERKGVITIPLKIQDPQPPDGETWTLLQKEDNLSMHNHGRCGTFVGEGIDMLNIDGTALGDLIDMGCVRIPLQLKIDFIPGKPDGIDCNLPAFRHYCETKMQETCIFLDVPIQPRIDVSQINEDFLEDYIEVFDSIASGLDSTNKLLTQMLKISVYSTGAGWVGSFILRIWELFACRGLTPEMKWYAKQSEGTDGGIKGKCDDNGLIELNIDNTVPNIVGKCKSCQAAISRRKKLMSVVNWFSDRVFCPTVPTFKKFVEDKQMEVWPSGQEESSCTIKGTDGYYYNSESLFDDTQAADGIMDEDCDLMHNFDEECCAEEYRDEWNSACVMMDELDESRCLENPSSCNGGEAAVVRGISSVCSGSEQGGFQDFIYTGLDYQPNNQILNLDLARFPSSGTAPPPSAIIYNLEVDKNNQAKLYRGFIVTDMIKAEMSPDNQERIELKSGIFFVKEPETPVADFKVSDILDNPNARLRKRIEYAGFKLADLEKELKDASNNHLQTDKAVNIYDDIVRKIGTTKREYVIDPTSGIGPSFACGCISGLKSYVQQYRDISLVIKECLTALRYTGDGSAGVCESLVSQYTCDLLIDVIQCFGGGYTKGAGSRGSSQGGITGFFGELRSIGADIQSSIYDRYRGRNMFDSMFNSKSLTHGVCHFAFNREWPMPDSLENMFDLDARPMETGSTVMFVLPKRRLNGIDRRSTPEGLTTYVYQFGLLFAAGADVRYNVKLVCSNDNSCNGPCDCVLKGRKELPLFLDAPADGSLTQGEVLNENFFVTVTPPDNPYNIRYDKIVLEYEYEDPGVYEDLGGREATTITSSIREEGAVPKYCEFDPVTLAFRCNYNMGIQEGYVRFQGRPVPLYPSGKNYFETFDDINFRTLIENQLPSDAEPCTNVNCPTTKYLGIKVYNQNGVDISDPSARPYPLVTSRLYEITNLPSVHMTSDLFTKSVISTTCQIKHASDFNWKPGDAEECAENSAIDSGRLSLDGCSSGEGSPTIHVKVKDADTLQYATLTSGPPPGPGQKGCYHDPTGYTDCTALSNRINCGGITFNKPSTMGAGTGAVIKTDSSSAGEGECTSNIETWKAEFELVYANDNGIGASNRRVLDVSGDQDVFQEVSFNTRCRPSSASGGCAGGPVENTVCNCAGSPCEPGKYCYMFYGGESMGCYDSPQCIDRVELSNPCSCDKDADSFPDCGNDNGKYCCAGVCQSDICEDKPPAINVVYYKTTDDSKYKLLTKSDNIEISEGEIHLKAIISDDHGVVGDSVNFTFDASGADPVILDAECREQGNSNRYYHCYFDGSYNLVSDVGGVKDYGFKIEVSDNNNQVGQYPAPDVDISILVNDAGHIEPDYECPPGICKASECPTGWAEDKTNVQCKGICCMQN